jgi:8-oxo-dGTP diphosphatase
VWRRDPASGDVQVCVIHRPRHGDWTFPKGKLSEGEAHLDGARREVAEETGFAVEIGRALGETRYAKSDGGSIRPKVVRYWAMEATGGRFSPNDEVDEIVWLTAGEAARLLTYDHDRAVLARFVAGA